MNLCLITSSFPAFPEDSAAAAGLFVRDFAVELTKLGHAVTVVTPDKQAERKEDPPGVPVHWFPWRGGDQPLSLMKLSRPSDFAGMISVFRNGRRTLDALTHEVAFDHVLAMWAVPAGLLAAGLKRRRGVPFTTWCLGADIWTYGEIPILKKIVASVLRQSDLIYADGYDLAKTATRLSGRECPFLPSSRRLNKDLVKPVDRPTDGLSILFIGRYHTVKGVDVLLEAMARFLKDGHQGHLQLFGGGPEEEAIRRRASQDDLKDHVTVGGFADEQTCVSYIAACDVFVIPSRMESIPVVFSDALQMGKPVIASDVGDMGRLLRETPAGLVVPPGDPAALVNAFTEFADEDGAKFADAVESLAARFNIAHTAEEWIGHIQELATGRA